MTTLPEPILMMLIAFIPVFSQPTWKKTCVLIVGSILCFNHRTVAACLRVMGLDQDNNFSKYHQVLNRARWSGLKAAQILLGLLLRLVPRGFPVIIGVDETIERRKGNKIKAKGCYRDAVKSSRNLCCEMFRAEMDMLCADRSLALEFQTMGSTFPDAFATFKKILSREIQNLPDQH